MRGGLGLIVVAWLNLAMQPCAMALGNMEDHDCPRCPASHEDERAEHLMHAGHMAGEETASAETPCSTAATDCSLFDEFHYDGRTVKLELNDAPHDFPIVIGTPFGLDSKPRYAEYLAWHSTGSSPLPASVPLNVYYCVYLK